MVYDAKIARNFYFQPGLYFTSLGGKIENEEGMQTTNLHYFQLPALLSFRIPLCDRMKLHLNAGCYAGFGLAGNVKQVSFRVNAFGDEVVLLKRWDAGLSFGGGVNFWEVYCGLGYDVGLVDIYDDSRPEVARLRNRNFHLSVGYSF